MLRHVLPRLPDNSTTPPLTSLPTFASISCSVRRTLRSSSVARRVSSVHLVDVPGVHREHQKTHNTDVVHVGVALLAALPMHSWMLRGCEVADQCIRSQGRPGSESRLPFCLMR